MIIISFWSMRVMRGMWPWETSSAELARMKQRIRSKGKGGFGMRTKLAIVILAVMPAWAHHAFQAEFDDKKPVTLSGKVTDMEWINPHAWIHIDVTGPDGKVTNWMVEGGSPNILLRRGFNKNTLEKGQHIT